MNTRISLKIAVAALAILTIFGCGGGGGGGGGGTEASNPTTPTTPGAPGAPGTPGAGPTAVLKLSTQGTLPAGVFIGGVDVTVNLPAGVTARADAAGSTITAVVNPTGTAQGGISLGKYTAASGTTPGMVRVAVVKADGFLDSNKNPVAGEFATLNLDITGATPAATGFTVSGLSVTDLNGNPITVLTATTALQVQ